MNILIYKKGGTFYDQVVNVEEGWVEQEFVLLITAALPSEAGLPNE